MSRACASRRRTDTGSARSARRSIARWPRLSPHGLSWPRSTTTFPVRMHESRSTSRT
jgi:hypothetical protein